MTLSLFADARGRRLLDNIERIVVTAFFVWLCTRFATSLADKPANAFFLVSEGIVALMVLLRRSTDDISVKPTDWAVAFAGTLMVMLVTPGGEGWSGAVVLLVAGLAISLGAKLSLRRSFGVVAANRGIKRSGMYAAVRHPMYLGYFLTNAGVLLLNPSIWNAVLLSAWAAMQVFRIHAEERILMRDADYRAHADRVRFRLVPFVY